MRRWGRIQHSNLQHSNNPFLPSSHLHFAVGAGNPDLFRTRLAGSFPIHGALHDVVHLGEPPACAGDAPPMPRRVGAPTLAVGVETEFQLIVCRICHNEPFFARHSGRGGLDICCPRQKRFREYVLNANPDFRRGELRKPQMFCKTNLGARGTRPSDL